MKPRQWVLGLAALATLASSVWALRDDGGDDELTTPKHGIAVRAAPRAMADTVALKAREPQTDETLWALPDRSRAAFASKNLFAATTAAPLMVIAAAASSPASAPPPPITLPFSFGGRLVTAEGASVLLNQGATTQVLALGGTLGDFRFEQDSGSQLDFIHVPTGEHVVLALQP